MRPVDPRTDGKRRRDREGPLAGRFGRWLRRKFTPNTSPGRWR